MSTLRSKLAEAWNTRSGKVLTIGAATLGVLGVISNVVGILDYVGVNPVRAGGLPITPSAPVAQVALGPTPIPLSSTDEIRRDDFSSKSTGWNDYSTSNAATGYENGRYFIQLSEYILFLSIWKGAGMIDNGVLQVDALSQRDEGGYAQGIGFGWRSGWEGSTYAFTIDSFGNCQFLEATDGWRTKTAGKVSGFDGQWSYHTLRVYIRNSEAMGYVDDTFCAKYTMPNYKRGYVGVVASPNVSRKSGKYYFAEYRIYRIP